MNNEIGFRCLELLTENGPIKVVAHPNPELAAQFIPGAVVVTEEMLQQAIKEAEALTFESSERGQLGEALLHVIQLKEKTKDE